MVIREIQYKIINEEHREKAGIYVMYVGDMLYIGKAHNFRKRTWLHSSFENDAFRQYAHTKKHNKRGNKKLIKHLADNPHIETVFVEIVEICDNLDLLEAMEMLWIETAIKIGFGEILLNVKTYNFTFISYEDHRAMGLI